VFDASPGLMTIYSEAVEARPPSVGYRLRKFVRRHTDQMLAASMILLALLVGITGTTLGLIAARRQEAEAKKQEQIARDEASEKEAARLADAGQKLLGLKKWAEAEPILRECLTLREKGEPES
jgi:hypothetical protein